MSTENGIAPTVPSIPAEVSARRAGPQGDVQPPFHLDHRGRVSEASQDFRASGHGGRCPSTLPSRPQLCCRLRDGSWTALLGLLQPGGGPQGWLQAAPLTRPGSGRCSRTFTPCFLFLPYSLCSPSSCHKCLELPPCASRAAPRTGPVSTRLGRAGAGRRGSQLHATLPRTEPAVPCASCLDGPPDCEVLVRCFFFKFLSTYRRMSAICQTQYFALFLKCLEMSPTPPEG